MQLQSSECIEDSCEKDWAALNLDGYVNIYMYLKKVGEVEAEFRIECVGVTPLTDGNVLLCWPEDVLADISGRYEGEFEVRYSNGRIVTTYQPIKFDIRNDFSGNGGVVNACSC